MKALFLAVAAVLSLGCTPAIAGDNTQAEVEIRTLYDAVLAEWVACDMAEFFSHSTREHTVYYPGSGEAMLQTGTEAKALAEEFCNAEGEREADYRIEGLKVMYGMALVYGSGRYELTGPDGQTVLDFSYTFTDVLVDTEAGWKFLHTHLGTR